MSNKINLEGVMLFEQPFVRVPFENYRKIFRTSQKNIERDLTAVQTSAKDLAVKGAMPTESLGSEHVLSSIDAMIGKVEGLKRKIADLHTTAGQPTQEVLRERLHHLATVESLSDGVAVDTSAANTDSRASEAQVQSETEFARWADTRLDRWIVDWCLRNGKLKSASIVAKEKGIETLVDIDLFSDIRRIEDALSRHSCTEALAWCSENKAALRKAKSTLEFDLRMQEYIELSRNRKAIEAIAYSRKYLIPWQETHLAHIRQLSALLAFPADTACGPYKRLYDPSRWTTLAKNFRLAIYNLNTLSNEPLLHLSLYAGLVALKLPACFDDATKNVDCPVCDGESAAVAAASASSSLFDPPPSSISVSYSHKPALGLGKLAKEVPYSHHANSTIVCRLTGKIMDADNMPLAFPNGYVYSREALEDMAAKNNGYVTCKVTGETCEFRKLKKVFIP